MNTERFTLFWNYARVVAIAMGAFIITATTIKAHCFAPNLEIDHFDRNDSEDSKPDHQKSEEAREDSKHDDDYHSYTDNQGNDHHFKDGAELS